MSEYLDKDALTSQEMPEDDVELGRGKVRVRGVSRGETLRLQKAKESGAIKDVGAWERRMVSMCLLVPTMTEIEVGEWQEADPAGGDLQAVTDKISELSGMSEGSEKEAMASFRDGPDAGIRVLPSDQAGDDGGATPGADVE